MGYKQDTRISSSLRLNRQFFSSTFVTRTGRDAAADRLDEGHGGGAPTKQGSTPSILHCVLPSNLKQESQETTVSAEYLLPLLKEGINAIIVACPYT